jgi:hypothetical protein
VGISLVVQENAGTIYIPPVLRVTEVIGNTLVVDIARYAIVVFLIPRKKSLLRFLCKYLI